VVYAASGLWPSDGEAGRYASGFVPINALALTALATSGWSASRKLPHSLAAPPLRSWRLIGRKLTYPKVAWSRSRVRVPFFS